MQDAHCQMLVGGASMSISLPLDQCVVPDGIEGPVALFITADDQPLNNNVRDRTGQAVLAGPAMAFIDTQKQLLSQLALAAGSSGSNNSANSGNSGSSSSSTTTITPPEASSIIASASSASAAAPTATDGSSGSSNQSSSTDGNGGAANAQSGSAAAPAPSSTGGAAAAAPPESDKTVVASPGTRNLATGPSANGVITVDGWQDNQPAAN